MRALLLSVAAAAMATGAAAGEWSGGYVGGQVGFADVDPAGLASGDGSTFGLHVGYHYDFGDWVIGGELDWDHFDISIAGGTVTTDNVGRAKLKLGYDFGPAMGYATVAAARVKTSIGNDTGSAYGLGFAVPLAPQWSLSGEYLRHEFKNIGGTGVDADADSFTVRASFRF